MNTLTAFGGRVSRHTAIYASGSGSTLLFALFSVAVLTRFLRPTEYGELALLLFFAALLTVAYNLGSLQGGLIWVFGASGEEEEDEPPGDDEVAGQKRRALGTALVLTVLIAGTGTALIATAVSPLAELLTGDPDNGDDVMLAAVSGALGAVWRLVSNVLRMERRPVAYVVLSNVRPMLVVAAIIPLVAGGLGVQGALLGTAGGTALAIAVGMVVTRRSYSLAFELHDVRSILRKGSPVVPIIVAVWVVQNADLFLLSRYAPDQDVGLYRVASRVGAVVSYVVAAFLMAWSPLTRTPLFAAADKERGRPAIGGTMATYFALGAITLVFGLAVAADSLIRIAPPAYADAAPLIPLIGLGFALYGGLVVVNRAADFPRKRLAYVSAAIVSAVVFLAAALLLIPWIGSYGAALAVVAGFSVGTVVLVFRSQRGPNPIPFAGRRVALAAALAAASLAVAHAAGTLAGDWGPAVELAALVVYPMLLVATGVIPRDHARALKAIVLGLSPRRRPMLDAAALQRVAAAEREVLELVVRQRGALDQAARKLGATEAQASARLVRALRQVGGTGQAGELDSRIGDYLFSRQPPAERDLLARRLWAEGVEPLEVDALEETVSDLRRLPPSAWRAPDEPAATVGQASDGSTSPLVGDTRPGSECGAAESAQAADRAGR
jgi:O-antigen/teichoic acid export membrane protein